MFTTTSSSNIGSWRLNEQNILNYCISGDLKLLKECESTVKHAVHKNSRDGQTCLIAACRHGHLKVAQYLVEVHGADVQQVGVVEFEGEQVEGVPPLWCAAAAGHLKLIDYLISKGADVNHTTITNSTALRAACFDGHEEVVRYLVEHGANIENFNRHGHTCLMISCYRRHNRIVEYLLSQHARVNRRSGKGNTALHDCAECGNLKGMQLLLKHRAVMRKDEYGQSPILSGANSGFKKIVDYLADMDDPIISQYQASPISIYEKIAAYDLLGASLYDRHTLVQDTIGAWFHAMRLRESIGRSNKFDAGESVTCSCTASSTTKGSCWHLVSLAAREAVGMANATRTDHSLASLIRDMETTQSRPVVPRIDHNATLHTRKRIVWLRQLQTAYWTLYSNNKKATELRTSLDQLPRQGGESSGQCYSVGLIQSSPIHPILGIEPQFWEQPLHRRLPLDLKNTTVSPTRPPQPRRTKNSKFLGKCPHCQFVLFSVGNVGRVECICANCNRSFADRIDNDDQTTGRIKSLVNLKPEYFPFNNDACLEEQPSNSFLCSQCHLATENHPLVERLKQCGEEAFRYVREFDTYEELVNLMQNTQAFRLQSLFIRLRILGPDHPDTTYFIRYRGAIYADAHSFRQCLNLWRYALELQRIFLEPLCHVAQAAFVYFAELFYFILTNNYGGLSANDLDPTLIIDCLELAVENIERGIDYSFYQWYRRHPWSYTTADKEAINLMRHIAVCLHYIALILTYYIPNEKALPFTNNLRKPRSDPVDIVNEKFKQLVDHRQLALLRVCEWGREGTESIMSHLGSLGKLYLDSTNQQQQTNNVNSMERQMSPALKQRFFKQVYRFVKLDPRVHRGQSLIHLACSPETSTVGRFVICNFPNFNVLHLLFELGANPNCPDVDGQRPIGHILTQRRLNSSDLASLLSVLVKNGAHLDASNRNSLKILDPRFHHILTESRICVLDHITLACQAVCAAKRAGFTSWHPYVRSYLPEHLLEFFDLH